MSLSFREESIVAIRPEIEAIMHEHWQEVCDDPDMPLNVNWDRYEELDAAGVIKTLAVRDNTTLVGYIVFILLNLLHYQQVFAAHDDAFFLKKEHRKGMVALKMFRFAEDMLRAYGVQRIFYHEKFKAPASGRVFEFMGYKPIERIWSADIRKTA